MSRRGKCVKNKAVPVTHGSWNGPLLLDAEANDVRDQGITALHEACRNGHTEIAEVLIQNGAQVNVTSSLGRTPIHFAAYKGHVGPVRVLLEHGADIHKRGLDGRTPLHDAALMGHTDIAFALLEHGADPDLQSFHNSFSAVDIAATQELAKIIDTIVSIALLFSATL